MPINYCNNTNPLENIPVNNEYDYQCQDNQQPSCPKPHSHVRSHSYAPISHSPITIPALGGDVIGSLTNNKVVAIQNIPVLCGYPKEGQILVINKQCRFELRSMTAIETLTIKPNNGLKLILNELSVDCAELANHCNLANIEYLEDNYLPLVGGTISGNLILEGNLKINDLATSSTRLLAIDSSGNVVTRPLTAPGNSLGAGLSSISSDNSALGNITVTPTGNDYVIVNPSGPYTTNRVVTLGAGNIGDVVVYDTLDLTPSDIVSFNYSVGGNNLAPNTKYTFIFNGSIWLLR